jgi:hypothetical protein
MPVDYYSTLFTHYQKNCEKRTKKLKIEVPEQVRTKQRVCNISGSAIFRNKLRGIDHTFQSNY